MGEREDRTKPPKGYSVEPLLDADGGWLAGLVDGHGMSEVRYADVAAAVTVCWEHYDRIRAEERERLAQKLERLQFDTWNDGLEVADVIRRLRAGGREDGQDG